MPAQQFFMPYTVVLNTVGLPEAGATLTFYLSGTTTKTPVYTTDALTVEHTNPVVANAAGRVADIYLNDSINYRLVLKSAAGATLEDIDPYIPGAYLGQPGPSGTLEASGLTFGTPEQFGAVGNNVADDYPAFVAALAYLKTLGTNTGGYIATPTLYCPNTYYLSQTLEIKQCLRIQGQGVGQQSGASRSVLRFPASTCGIRIHRHNTNTNTTVAANGDRADGTIIDGIVLSSAGGAANLEHSGIWMRARATITNCQVSNFAGHGLMIRAGQGSGGAAEGNANCWRVENCSFLGNELSGFYLDGADSNAGMSSMVDASNNKQYGIYDSSFLGNTHINRHCEGNVLGSIKTDDNNARTMFIGGYDETGWPGTQVISPSIVLHGFQGGTGNVGPSEVNDLSDRIMGGQGLRVGGKIEANPGNAVTPTSNGSVTFQLTNDTTITFKAKGSDGVVRSGSITLA